MFVGRRDDKTIYGLWSVRQWDGQEKIADDHADVLAFRQRNEAPAEKTAAQKLAVIGLTVPDLKQLLGLK